MSLNGSYEIFSVADVGNFYSDILRVFTVRLILVVIVVILAVVAVVIIACSQISSHSAPRIVREP